MYMHLLLGDANAHCILEITTYRLPLPISYGFVEHMIAVVPSKMLKSKQLTAAITCDQIACSPLLVILRQSGWPLLVCRCSACSLWLPQQQPACTSWTQLV